MIAADTREAYSCARYPFQLLRVLAICVGGLTEEEIAAFQAKAQAAQFTRGVARLSFGKQQ